MKVVLDTNVMVSGLLSPFGPSAEIVRMVASGVLKLCYDARILSEYQSVLLRKKFLFDRIHVENLIEQIRACGYIVASRPLSKRLPHLDDEPFLEIALEGEAQYLVTGNLKHYPAIKCENIRVVSPTAFLEIFRKKKNSRRIK